MLFLQAGRVQLVGTRQMISWAEPCLRVRKVCPKTCIKKEKLHNNQSNILALPRTAHKIKDKQCTWNSNKKRKNSEEPILHFTQDKNVKTKFSKSRICSIQKIHHLVIRLLTSHGMHRQYLCEAYIWLQQIALWY